MHDVQVDLDEFYQEFEIKITNPIHRNDALPAKYKIMIALREKYLKHRNVYKRIFREKQSEEFMLNSNSYESRNYEIKCSAEPQYDCKTGEKIEPYIELEAIEIVDILPKEFLPAFQKKIQRMVKENYVDGFNHTEETNVNVYKKVHNSYFRFSAASLSFRPGCEFSRYASGLNIEMVSLSSSFVGLVYRFWINKDWKDKINNLCIKDRAKHEFYSGMERLRWHQFRRIGKGINPGNIYKEKMLAALLEEIKYRLAKELHKEFQMVIFSMNEKAIAFNIFKTNIDGNSSKEFWKSIGIEARFCNFLKGQDACINPLHRENLDLDYIYKRNKKDRYDSECVAYDIVERFVEYLCVVGLKNAIEDQITQISVWIQRGQKANLDTWLQIKSGTDNSLMYATRFVNEFKSRGYLDPSDYDVGTGATIAKNAVENLDKTVEHCKKLIDDTVLVVNSNVEARNGTLSYRMQKTSFYLNLCSAIFALIAIIISLLSDEVRNIAIDYMSDSMVIRCTLCVAIVISVSCMMKSLVVGLINCCRKKIIFR